MSRLTRILRDVVALGADVPLVERLCLTAVELTDVTGAGVSVITDTRYQATLCVSGQFGEVEQLQFTLGEGPCISANMSGEPVLAPDLVDDRRWPLFRPAAVETGVRAVFGYPLQFGAARVGALSLFRAEAGPLTPDAHAYALLIADFTGRVVVTLRATGSADDPDQLLASEPGWHWQVHQATGMISVQLDVPLDEALVRLRAFAFAEGRPIGDVAADVVARRLRFEDDTV